MFSLKYMFNMFAFLIRTALDCTDEPFFERYSALEPERWEEINKDVKKFFPTLFYNGHIVQMSDSLCSKELLEQLRAVVMGKKEEYDKQLLVLLLTILDSSMSKYIENYVTKEAIKGINSNADQTKVQLLPRVKCSWEHSNRGSCHYNGLINYLNFFYFIDMNKTNGYEIWNQFLSDDTFSTARKRKALKIGMCPLTNQGNLNWTKETRNGIGYFSITDIEDKEIIEENMLKLNVELKKHQVDIAIMPEMLGNHQIEENFKEIFSEFPDDGCENCPLIVFPSIWSNHHNIVTVFNEQGDIVIQQEKQHPFLYTISKDERYLEDIQPEKKISLIHCDGVGRIAILICKDALMIEYIQMVLNILKVTLLIIPSFSTGNYDFQEIVQCCRSADCCVCWINTCSVANLNGANNKKLEPIGFFLRCGKKSELPDGIFRCNRKEQSCCNGEERDCGRCVFTFDLPFG